jgi:two-component system response regulator HydG
VSEPTQSKPSVLVVEDDPALLRLLSQALPHADVRLATNLDEAHAALEPAPDAILTDVHLGPESGLDLLRHVREVHPSVPVLVMTAFGDVSVAVEALRSGAYDFLTKPLDLSVLRAALDRALETRRLRREVHALRREVRIHRPVHQLVGESPAIRSLHQLVSRVGPTQSSVLIQGESGTGKELVARALHDHSPRATKSFTALNCAAIPESLLESELFGHRAGAFTDARAPRRGLFQQTDGGTLFLDEIGDLPLSMQAKLLRVLQERTVRPVGSDADVPIDVRVIAATHRDLDALVAEGRFREDLLFRLDVINIEVPPLRARGRDILLLAQTFLHRLAKQLDRTTPSLAPEAARLLLDHPWPGNVRELQNSMERAIVLCDGDTIEVGDLPPRLRRAGVPATEPGAVQLPDAAHLLPLEEVERRYILQVLNAVGGRRAEAARILQVDRKTLYRKLERWSLEAKG